MSSNLEDVLEVNENKNSTNVSREIPTNKISDTLKAIGFFTLTLGVLAGILIGLLLEVSDPVYSSLSDPHPLRWVYGGALIISSFVSGFTFIGFGEIIDLLHQINTKNKV